MLVPARPAELARPLKPCLYCEQEAVTKGAEHVLQHGLGGGTCLDPGEVCDECNTRVFSPLDGHLVRIVHDLLCRDHPDVVHSRNFLRGHHVVHRDEQNSVWVSVRLDEHLRVRICDQFVRIGPGQWHVSMDLDTGEQPLVRHSQIVQELRAVTPEEVSIVVIDDREPAVEPAIVRSARGRFVVRGATVEVAEDLRTQLLKREVFVGEGIPSSVQRSTISNPSVHVRIRIEDGAIGRALAKVAMNVVCHALGPVIARSPDFDTVRKFVLDGRHRDQESTITQLIGSDDERLHQSASLMCPPNHHCVRLEPGPDGLYACICLYQRPIARVRMSWATPPANMFAMVLFNYKRRGSALVVRERHLCPLPGDQEWDELAQAS
jgi:hypothetical protein